MQSSSSSSNASLKSGLPLAVFRRMFYLVTPQETSFATPNEVPNYVNEAVPYFILLIIVEYIICAIQKQPRARFNDGISSVSAGIISQVILLFIRSVEVSTYVWFHAHFCIVELPWDSTWTWLLCFFALDLGYYWLHRMAHENSFSWSGHQVHHSSEAYNLTTALRQSVSQRFFGWIYYMPLAFFIPPSVFLVHLQFNLIYQFWIHTELIRTLGPLEWVLNTPSHHRVHHGRNPYCIDKNYGGTLIIYDRLFGTFAAERPEERVAYGLVHPLQSFDPIYVQMCHLIYLWSHVRKQTNWKDRLKALAYGPGWDVGKPRLGDPADIPEIPKTANNEPHAPVYDPPQHNLVKAYCSLHFIASLGVYLVLVTFKTRLSVLYKLAGTFYIVLSLTVFGNLFDPRDMFRGLLLEFMRLVVHLAAWVVTEVAIDVTEPNRVLLRVAMVFLGPLSFAVWSWMWSLCNKALCHKNL